MNVLSHLGKNFQTNFDEILPPVVSGSKRREKGRGILILQNSVSPTVFVFLLNELIVFCFPPKQSSGQTSGGRSNYRIIPNQNPASQLASQPVIHNVSPSSAKLVPLTSATHYHPGGAGGAGDGWHLSTLLVAAL